MTTFGLVHGSWHGAWCWAPLVPELEARGHRAVAVDLPCEDPAAGCVQYAEVVHRALPEDADLVLVGHSLGGLTIPLVAALRPVRRLIFLCAVLPAFNKSFEEQLAAEPAIYAPGYAGHPGRLRYPDGSTAWHDVGAAARFFYHDCSPETARWACGRLRRQAATPRHERCPLRAWPPAARASIVCQEDRAISPEWSCHAAREQLGVEPETLPGGHTPFLSRPGALAAVLDRLA